MLNNKSDPLDELVFIILSQMTTGPSYERVYDRLKSAMPDWQLLTETPIADLSSLIADAGLSGQRASRLKLIATRLTQDFGEVSLATLVDYDDKTAQRYLTSLPGVGVKTAKCVMMYSLGRQVLPVDTHTARIATRLGLVSPRTHAVIDRELSLVVSPRAPLRLPRERRRSRPRRLPRGCAKVSWVRAVLPVSGRAARQPPSPSATNVTVVVNVTFLLRKAPLIGVSLQSQSKRSRQAYPKLLGCAIVSSPPMSLLKLGEETV